MGLIGLEGMQFYAYHGYYEEERLTGNDYLVDIYLNVELSAAAQTGDLAYTVNYETVYRIAKIEMSKPSLLLEPIADRIIEQVMDICRGVQGIKVRIVKQNPPMGARIDKAYIETEAGHF